jgi:hypothetical protein
MWDLRKYKSLKNPSKIKMRDLYILRIRRHLLLLLELLEPPSDLLRDEGDVLVAILHPEVVVLVKRVELSVSES